MDDLDLSIVDRVVGETGSERRFLIPILQQLQNAYRYLPEAALRRVCEITDMTAADVVGMSSFYDHFRFKPLGEHVIRVCHGTACHVKGAPLVHESLADHLGIPAGEDTDPDGRFTIQKVACLGCCTLAPVIQADERTYGFVTPARVREVLVEIERFGAEHESTTPVPERRAAEGAAEIRVGLGSCCMVKGSDQLFDNLRREVDRIDAPVRVRRVGCVGACHRTPIVEVVDPTGTSQMYSEVAPGDAESIVREHFAPSDVLGRARAAVARTLDTVVGGAPEPAGARLGVDVRDPAVTAFLGKQKHIAAEHCGELDPLDFEQYESTGGFEALRKILADANPDALIATIEQSGLRGRGGAGFPTGRKWRFAHDAEGRPKTVVCNGDEGDPGAFMDRMILESYPLRVIEGMTIAARAMGAPDGIFYIREEYPLALARVTAALDACRARGLLGMDIGESGFSFDIRIVQGAGAFVCGEETALIASLEGRRGMPVLRPPFPVERGYAGGPTLVNNVETLSCVPWIIHHGAEAFAALGTEKSKGTKVFSLAGKVRRGGLIEVPAGITIREIVEDIGGGVPDGEFKAVQVGGPSGGCIPATLADTSVDYEALTGVGAMMGSGGLVVLDERDCMVDMARYFLDFTQRESCGKCTLCRIGTRRMLDILERMCAGQGKATDIDDLETLAAATRDGSVCALGRTAPNPVLTTLRYFRDEYEAHLEGRCPAGRCRELITYSINDRCTGCTLCARACPVDAIGYAPYRIHEIDAETCTRCDVCRGVCPEDAVDVR